MIKPLFCGNFEYDARQSDLERLFRRYGRVERVDMKSGFFLGNPYSSWLMDALFRILFPACDKLPLLVLKKSHSFPQCQNNTNFPDTIAFPSFMTFAQPQISDMFQDSNITDLTAEAAE